MQSFLNYNTNVSLQHKVHTTDHKQSIFGGKQEITEQDNSQTTQLQDKGRTELLTVCWGRNSGHPKCFITRARFSQGSPYFCKISCVLKERDPLVISTKHLVHSTYFPLSLHFVIGLLYKHNYLLYILIYLSNGHAIIRLDIVQEITNKNNNIST